MEWNIIVLSSEKILKIQIQKFQILVMVKQWYYKNAQYGVGKNQDLLKIKKEKDC